MAALAVVPLGLAVTVQAEEFYVIAGSTGTTKADALDSTKGVPTIQRVLDNYVGANATESFLLADQPGVDTALNKGSSIVGNFAWASFNGVTRYNGTNVVAPGGIDRGTTEQ